MQQRCKNLFRVVMVMIYFYRIISYQLKLIIMAKKTIQLRIDVTRLNKDYFFTNTKTREDGTKPIYADVVCFYDDEQDEYGNNGMIVQSLPKDIWEKEKHLPAAQRTKGNILGNAKNFATNNEARREASPGYDGGESASTNTGAATNATQPPVADDLPF